MYVEHVARGIASFKKHFHWSSVNALIFVFSFLNFVKLGVLHFLFATQAYA